MSHVRSITALNSKVGFAAPRAPPKTAQLTELLDIFTELKGFTHRLSMSASEEDQPVDIGLGSGISSELADTARDEVLGAVQIGGAPITFVSPGAKTRAVSKEFLERGDKSEIARLLGILIAEVQKRFQSARPGIFNLLPGTIITPGRPDRVYTVLALGNLSYENGLPALGPSKQTYELKSGETLHFMGDLEQSYSRTGGGTLIWFHWSNLQ